MVRVVEETPQGEAAAHVGLCLVCEAAVPSDPSFPPGPEDITQLALCFAHPRQRPWGPTRPPATKGRVSPALSELGGSL